MPLTKFSIIFSLLFSCVVSYTYINAPFNQSSGIFYNKMGEAKIINSKLTLLSYINFTHLNQAFETIRQDYLQSENFCKLALEELSKYGYGSLYC